MAELKILRIEDGDSQKNLTDKCNYNFQEIVRFGGGPYGRIGPVGPDGPRGNNGPIGSVGDPGNRGNFWFIGDSEPVGTTGNPIFDGDFWVDTSDDNVVYIYSNSQWTNYLLNIKSQDLFDIDGPISRSSGITNKYGYFISSETPVDYNVSISDNVSAYTSGTTSLPNAILNPQYSKFVISTNSSSSGAFSNLLEFNKSDYLSSPAYLSGTPRFYWLTSGGSSTNNKYGLGFITGGIFKVESPTKTVTFRAGNGSFYLGSSGFNVSLNSQLGIFDVYARNFIEFNINGNVNFNARNIISDSQNFNFYNRFNQNLLSGYSSIPLRLISQSSSSGNLRYVYNASTNNTAILFDVNQISPTQSNLFRVYGGGLVRYNKLVTSLQKSQTITQTSSWSSPAIVNWTTVLPGISMNTSGSNFLFCNNGMDYFITKDPSASAGDRGIALWLPATGSSPGNYGGWLNLLENNESINFRVYSEGTNYLRYIGLNTGNSPLDPPNNTVSNNYSYADLSSGAAMIDITIINITGTGSTNGNRRWFKVYYSASGGGLGTIKCGSLVTYNSTA